MSEKRQFKMAEFVDVDFSKLTSKIFANFADHERSAKELCIKKSIMPLSKFYDTLQEEIKAINSETTPLKERGTVAEYAEFFKLLEEYPTNLQKPKKRELQRANSTIIKGSTATLAEVPSANHANTSPILNISKLEDTQRHQTSAYEIYSDFKKFQQKLRRAQIEVVNLSEVEDEYFVKLRELGTFAQQLKKLMPVGEHDLAFDSVEQQKLVEIAANMEQLNFIREHGCLFQQRIEGSNQERLRTLVDVLTYTLSQISI